MSTHSERMTLTHPYRGDRAHRPQGIPLPPARMPAMRAGRLLKKWRWVGVWGREMSVCAGIVYAGPVRQELWAVWHRAKGEWIERTHFLKRVVELPKRRMIVRDDDVSMDIEIDENAGFEVVTPDGDAYTWTRKQCGIRAHGTVRIRGVEHNLDSVAFIDDNAGYHARRTRWLWSGGTGTDALGRNVGWSVIVGLNDSPEASENTVWINGTPQEIGAVKFADDLSSVSFAEGGKLDFHQEVVRARRDNLILMRSDYSQPFGTFTGTLPGGIELREAYGVMERHDALW